MPPGHGLMGGRWNTVTGMIRVLKMGHAPTSNQSKVLFYAGLVRCLAYSVLCTFREMKWFQENCDRKMKFACKYSENEVPTKPPPGPCPDGWFSTNVSLDGKYFNSKNVCCCLKLIFEHLFAMTL